MYGCLTGDLGRHEYVMQVPQLGPQQVSRHGPPVHRLRQCRPRCQWAAVALAEKQNGVVALCQERVRTDHPCRKEDRGQRKQVSLDLEPRGSPYSSFAVTYPVC